MAKSKLLAEAIADAKAVRETALENARQVLEEAFAPKLQSMLSRKLEQELAEEELQEFENIEASGTNVGNTNDAPHPMGQTEDDLVMNEGESGYNADDHTVDQQGASNELSAGPTDQDTDSTTTTDTSSEGPNAGGKLTTSNTDHADVGPGKNIAASDQDSNQTPDVNTSTIRESDDGDDLESIIAELDGELDLGDDDEVPLDDEDLEGDLEGDVEVGLDDELSGEEPELDVALDIGDEVEGEESVGEELPVDMVAGDEEDEEIDLDEILREMELGDDADVSSDEMDTEMQALREENAEYKKAFGYLKSKLHEVNLLNAKLLFTNKVFKSYGLNNGQKMKVVEAFDRARSPREVKLTYANLRESFDIFNGNKKKSSITEGIASKAVKSTKPSPKKVEEQKQILSEGNELAARFKKLAGIK